MRCPIPAGTGSACRRISSRHPRIASDVPLKRLDFRTRTTGIICPTKQKRKSNRPAKLHTMDDSALVSEGDRSSHYHSPVDLVDTMHLILKVTSDLVAIGLGQQLQFKHRRCVRWCGKGWKCSPVMPEENPSRCLFIPTPDYLIINLAQMIETT